MQVLALGAAARGAQPTTRGSPAKKGGGPDIWRTRRLHLPHGVVEATDAHRYFRRRHRFCHRSGVWWAPPARSTAASCAWTTSPSQTSQWTGRVFHTKFRFWYPSTTRYMHYQKKAISYQDFNLVLFVFFNKNNNFYLRYTPIRSVPPGSNLISKTGFTCDVLIKKI